MAPQLYRSQARCTTPASFFLPSGVTPERTGVSTDDHGWWKYSGTGGFVLSHGTASDTIASTAFSWDLGYYFTGGQSSDGDYEEVVRRAVIVSLGPLVTLVVSTRLYNVSGEQKFRLWNVTADTQIGSDSAAVTVGQDMLVNMKIEESAETIELFLDGSSIISATSLPTFLTTGGVLAAGTSSTSTARYWSAWCVFFSASDDLNEAHYPEMRLLHPNGNEASPFDQYTGVYTDWDDLVSEGDPDGDSSYQVGNDGHKKELSTLTTHTMTNTIQAVAELLVLKADQEIKTALHSALIKEFDTFQEKSVLFGTEDIGTSYVVREAVFHTGPGGLSWTQGLIDVLDAGHIRTPGSEAFNIRVTAMGLVVVALGTTNLVPPDPPEIVLVGRRRVHFQLF